MSLPLSVTWTAIVCWGAAFGTRPRRRCRRPSGRRRRCPRSVSNSSTPGPGRGLLPAAPASGLRLRGPRSWSWLTQRILDGDDGRDQHRCLAPGGSPGRVPGLQAWPAPSVLAFKVQRGRGRGRRRPNEPYVDVRPRSTTRVAVASCRPACASAPCLLIAVRSTCRCTSAPVSRTELFNQGRDNVKMTSNRSSRRFPR